MSWNWKKWRFSAKHAWQNQWIRWMLICTILCIFTVSFWVLWRLIPEGIRSGVLVLHSNVYLGIDDVQSWQWIFIFPIGILSITLINTGIAFSLFHEDPLAAKALISLSGALTVIWSISLFFLVLVNL